MPEYAVGLSGRNNMTLREGRFSSSDASTKGSFYGQGHGEVNGVSDSDAYTGFVRRQVVAGQGASLPSHFQHADRQCPLSTCNI